MSRSRRLPSRRGSSRSRTGWRRSPARSARERSRTRRQLRGRAPRAPRSRSTGKQIVRGGPWPGPSVVLGQERRLPGARCRSPARAGRTSSSLLGLAARAGSGAARLARGHPRRARALHRVLLPRSGAGGPAGPAAGAVAGGRTRRQGDAGARREPARPGHAQVSIFLSVFDVHVNRAPDRRPRRARGLPRGRVPAGLRRQGVAAQRAEQRARWNRTASAGGVQADRRADRAPDRLPQAGRAMLVERGERVGMIKFGSRVDVFVRRGRHACACKLGDRVHRRGLGDRRSCRDAARARPRGRMRRGASILPSLFTTGNLFLASGRSSRPSTAS